FTAWRSGDYTIRTSGYLTLNPRTYFTPTSVIFPVVALVMGGIALPGGAVMIRLDLVRKPWQRSLIAFAGPAATLACAMVTYGLALLLRDSVSTYLFEAVMLLAFFLLMAFLLNMLPIPGLDGFAIIDPWLPRKWRIEIPPKYKAVVMLGLIALVFFQGARVVYPIVFGVTNMLGIDVMPALVAQQRFHFW
ncbi:MAG: site-2 protease family protein, partial [Asticcacaulis sp.]|nr:site-2 protease family protein [Asticcacaulis sp.]